MTKRDTTRPTAESGQEVAKQTRLATFSKSKFSPGFWADKVFRPTYTRDGQRFEVAEFWARIQHAGRREKLALSTNDRQEASRKAALLYQRVKATGWQSALAEFAPDRATAKGVPTVGELLDAAAKAADVSPRSLRNYGVCFRRIVADAFGIRGDVSRFDYRHGGREAWRQRIDRIRLDKLTPARVQAALNSRVADARGNPLAEQPARTTAASVLRQAKSLFSPNLKLPFENLPNPFEGVRVKSGTPRKYASTIDAAELLRDGKAELAEADPEAYKALLLALGAGLRKAEIDCLQWQQVDTAANVIRVATTEAFATKTDSSEGEVYVDPGLVSELDAYRAAATSLFVLESPFAPRPQSRVAYYRAARTFDRLTKWLRGKGVMGHKPIHALRKEFGSLVCASADIHTASRQLRHASIALTSTYYVDNRRRVAPPIGAMLASNPEQTTATVTSK
ncbi:MAG: site-specific integrase [Chloroflexi bacterium]|nr:site-specific integrase [Chloroflexota bacterium]